MEQRQTGGEGEKTCVQGSGESGPGQGAPWVGNEVSREGSGVMARGGLEWERILVITKLHQLRLNFHQ